MSATFTPKLSIPCDSSRDMEDKYWFLYPLNTENLCVVRSKENYKLGVYNLSLSYLVLAAEYDEIESTSFSNLWIVKIKDKWGLFDSYIRSFIFEAIYNKLQETAYPHLWWLKQTTHWYLYDTNLSDFVSERGYDDVYDISSSKDIWHVSNGLKHGLYNISIPAVSLDLEYSLIFPIGGLNTCACIVHKNNKQGVYDFVTATFILPPEYDKMVYSGYSNVEIIQKDGKCGVYNMSTYTFVFPMVYDLVEGTGYPGFLRMKKDGRCGIYNLIKYTFSVPMEYENVETTFSTDLWIVEINGRRGVYNLANATLEVDDFDTIQPTEHRPNEFRATRGQDKGIITISN